MATAQSIPISEHEAEAGRFASSEVAPLKLDPVGQLEERLQDRKLDRIIADGDWLKQDNSDFHQRMIRAQYNHPGASAFAPASISGSDTSSKAMAVSVTSISLVDSDPLSRMAPPSLVSHSTIETGSLARTSHADSVVPNLVLDEDDDGNLVQRNQPPPKLPCIFWFLKCQDRFDGLEEWDEHCKSHLGKPLPRTTNCPFLCDWQTSSETGEEAWQLRRIHIEVEHETVGVVDTSSRPSATLLHHLWSTNVINNAQFKDIKKNGQLTEDCCTFVQTSRSGPRGREREIRPTRQSQAV